MSDFESSTTCVPGCPGDVAACGVPAKVLEDLALKHLHPRGAADVFWLAHEMRLSLDVMREIVSSLIGQGGVVVPGTGDGATTEGGEPLSPPAESGTTPSAASEKISLTPSGRSRACEAFAVSRYLGPAPVSLPDYAEQCRKQRWDGSGISQDDLLSALTGVCLGEATLSDLQLALSTGGSVLFSGQSGNGKTLLASRLAQLIEQSSEAVYVPYAIWVDEGFLRVFEPSVHRPLDEVSPIESSDWSPTTDTRWRRVRRPVVTVSAELTRESFEIRSSGPGGSLLAPFHVLANGGMLVVDDLGRQPGSFTELMNRWLQPLEQQTDTVVLSSGRRLNLPVDSWLVFVAGEDAPPLPAPVARRVRCRVELLAPDRDRFSTLLLEEGRRRQMEVDESGVDALFEQCYNPHNPPKCSDPHILLQSVESICRMQKETVRARTDLLLAAALRLRGGSSSRAA